MARPLKWSMLMCMALLCQAAVVSSNTREQKDGSSSSSASDEGPQSDENRVPLTPFVNPSAPRGTINMFWNDQSAQREMAQRFPSASTNPIQRAIIREQRRRVAVERIGSYPIPLPEQPPFIPVTHGILATVTDNVRRISSFIHGIPAAVGVPAANGMISQSVQAVLNAPATFSNSVTRVPFSGSVLHNTQIQPSRPSGHGNTDQVGTSKGGQPNTEKQNSFPIVVVQSTQGNVNSQPTKYPSSTNHQGGLTIPVASGGVQPPSDYVPQDEPFIFENFHDIDPINQVSSPSYQTSNNGGGSSNGFPSQNTNNNFGSSTGYSNGGGSPNAIPSQNTNPFGSSVGSTNGGNSQQPNTNNFGTSVDGFPTQNSNNFFPQVSVSQNDGSSSDRFPSQNTNKFDGSQSYPEIFTVVDGLQVFTLDLLATFWRGTPDTVVYSPVSISSLLSLLTLATDGLSQHEIQVALSLPDASSSISHHDKYETILRRLNHVSQGITISTSSRLFLEESVEIFSTFSERAKQHYNCSVSLENFKRRPTQTMNRVNKWVEEETHGKIMQFISQPFSASTLFVAANTIYFDGEWATPFPEYFTAERDFDTGSEVIKIPMMTNVFETPHYYSEGLNVDVTSIPYRGGEFAMIIILPRESPQEKSIIDLERELDPSLIDSLVRNLTSKSVSISLPKMKLGMKTSLVENLSALSIKRIFSPSTADFSRLSNRKPLWVSEFLHEALMEVTEVGTVAAAVSAVSLDRIGGYQRINVNKPAIIFIRDMVTRVPLFWTRLVKPERIPESGQSKAPSPTKF